MDDEAILHFERMRIEYILGESTELYQTLASGCYNDSI